MAADEQRMKPMAVSSVHKIIDHHSAEPPPNDPHAAHDEAHDMAAGQWRSIQAFHMNTRGYADIAYHFGIAPDGAVYEGRLLQWMGAHAGKECNPGTIGIVFLTVDLLTDPAKRSYLELKAMLTERGFDVHESEPHSHCNATTCPGDVVRQWEKDGLPNPGGTSEPPAPPTSSCAALPPGPPPHGLPMLREGSTGDVVRLAQQRLLELGVAPANSRRADGSWDGQFGPGTAGAVRLLQAKNGLQVDGIIGRQVWCVFGVR